jgi:hypothetical protein
VPTLENRKNLSTNFQFEEHLYNFLHIYGSADGNGRTEVYVPPGGKYLGRFGANAAHKFFYETLNNQTNVTLFAVHIANFTGLRLGRKVEQNPGIPLNALGSVQVGRSGGTGGEVRGYVHSHFGLTADNPNSVKLTNTGGLANPIPFSKVFCK